MQSTPESNTATKLNGSVGSDGGVTAARYATMSLRRALLLLPSPPPPHPPPPEPKDGPAVTAGTLDELRAAMALSRVLTVYLTADVLLDGRELPPVLAPLRLLGACGGDGLSPCILDGRESDRAVQYVPYCSSLSLDTQSSALRNGGFQNASLAAASSPVDSPLSPHPLIHRCLLTHSPATASTPRAVHRAARSRAR